MGIIFLMVVVSGRREGTCDPWRTHWNLNVLVDLMCFLGSIVGHRVFFFNSAVKYFTVRIFKTIRNKIMRGMAKLGGYCVQKDRLLRNFILVMRKQIKFEEQRLAEMLA